MYKKVVENDVPINEQEVSDKIMMLELIDSIGDKILTRESMAAHMTVLSIDF